jgi:hypothetical protein
LKRFPILILRLAVFVAGAIVLAICGGAVHVVMTEPDPASTYFLLARILLAGVCFAAVPYFIALHQSYKLLGLIDTNRAFSDLSVHALKVITRCAFADFLICAAAGLPFFYTVAQIEDAPGLVVIGMTITGIAFVISVFASILNRLLQEVIAMKSENDLTI